VEAIAAPVRDMGELESVVAAQARLPNGGLIVLPDSFMSAHREEITTLAARYRLPAVYPFRYYAESGSTPYSPGARMMHRANLEYLILNHPAYARWKRQ
jgi:hypothetical protein